MPEPTPESPRRPSPPLITPSDELGQTLQRYLELRIRSLEREERQHRQAQRRERVRSEVGRMVTAAVILLTYSVVLGTITSATLADALLDPHRLVRNLGAAGGALGEITRQIPEALRGVAVSALGALGLLVLRSASFNLRAEIGGVLFVGSVALSLVGLSAAAGSGLLAAVAALPGFAAAVVVLHLFLETLQRIQEHRRRGPAARGGGLGIGRALAVLDPSGGRGAHLGFIGLLSVAFLCAAAATAVGGGPLFPVGVAGFIGLMVWFAWACALTPAAARIPLWSILPWALLFLSLFAFGAVSAIFAVAVIGTLVANVMLLTLRREKMASAPVVKLSGG